MCEHTWIYQGSNQIGMIEMNYIYLAVTFDIYTFCLQ